MSMIVNTCSHCSVAKIVLAYLADIQKMCELHKWPMGGTKEKEAKSTLALIWDGLKTFADENKDDMVTKDEWLKMWTECLSANERGAGLPEWQHKYMNFMFDVNDTSGDELIDMEEYTAVYTSYGLAKEDCEKAFDKFSNSGKDQINRKTFESLWTEYFMSNDPTAKGSYLFGTLTFQ